MIQPADTTSAPTKSAVKAAEDTTFDTALRPQDFSEYLGQTDVKKNLLIFLAEAKKRGEPLEHTLFAGPPGLGKTTIAHLIATANAKNLTITSGPAITKAADLAGLLTNLKTGDILFIDEIHRLKTTLEELLYTAMEDFRLDLVLGKGPSAKVMRLTLAPFTLIGATTRLASMSSPLRDRFGQLFRMEFYTESELAAILSRSAEKLSITLTKEASHLIAHASRGTPRIANRLLRRLRDFTTHAGSDTIDAPLATANLLRLGIDSHGLDSLDRAYLSALSRLGGATRPIGLATLAAAIAEQEDTLMDTVEPFLIQQLLIQRTPRGRLLTPAGTTICAILPS